MAYSAKKYASEFYGPFRDAVGLSGGNKREVIKKEIFQSGSG